MKNKHCQWCDNTFKTKLSYQIYCSPACREGATREKIAERYLSIKRKKRIGKVRGCKYCNAPLSVYNDDPLCDKCLINPQDVTKALKDIKGLLKDES
jgi:hypothetical protein